MPELNVVALISGGKDSLFSILHCQASGHNVVALANLHPPLQDGSTTEDMDSYMYQTIGHAVIPLYEEALGLPLYRQEIKGTAINKEKEYSPPVVTSLEDETESLFTLLQRVTEAQPAVNAVSTGAILSDYQRTRVESVALRLGLVPLSYLWQWPSLSPHTQQSLLEDMSAVGQDARIVKVASGGLDETFLWQNVADSRTITRLSRAAQRFGTAGDGAVLGEGGEYETLAVHGPSPLWKGRIHIADENIENVLGEAGSASVRIIHPMVMPFGTQEPTISNPRVPPLFDRRFEEIRETLPSDELDFTSSNHNILLDSVEAESDGGAVYLENISGHGETVTEQTQSVMDTIMFRLKALGHSVHNIVYAIIILSKMSDFGPFNAIYGKYFTKPNPAARVTVACADALAPHALLSISITSVLGAREGLHVQSRSYWAPANIGPYSQSIIVPKSIPSEELQGAVFIAGQIPLVPATMELLENTSSDPLNNFVSQALLSLQHLDRIGCTMGVRQWLFGIAFISGPLHGNDNAAHGELLLQTVWRRWHRPDSGHPSPVDEAEDFDVWDRKHGSGSHPWQAQGDDDPTEESSTPVPPLLVIQVDSLPRGADIEWVGYGRRMTSTAVVAVPAHLRGLVQVLRHRIVGSG